MTVTRCWRCHPVPKNQQVLANFVGQTTTTTTSWYETKALDSSREGGRGGSLWGVSATQNVKRKLCKINYNWKQMNAKTISSQRIPRKSHKAPTATLPIKIKERPQGVAQERERGRERWCTNQKLRALKQMFTPTKQAEQQQQQQLKRGQQAAACPVFGELELWQN